MYVGSRGGLKDRKGRGEANIMQGGAIELQHKTGGDGNFMSALKATTPSNGFGA
jgi:hypothetical protein